MENIETDVNKRNNLNIWKLWTDQFGFQTLFVSSIVVYRRAEVSAGGRSEAWVPGVWHSTQILKD